MAGGMRKLFIQAGVLVVLLAAAAIVLVLWHSGTFKSSVSSQLKKVSKATDPAWYAGDSVAGLKLTSVATAKGRRVAAFGYGDCHRHGSTWNPFATHSCGYPLLVQTWRLDEGADLSTDFVPNYEDGTCGRLTLRGVPASAGTTGVVLYSGSEAIAVLGPGNLLRPAVAALRRAGSSVTPATLPRPTTRVEGTLGKCDPARPPFEPVQDRIRRLLHESQLPLVTAGDWFRDGQLTNAEQVGKALTLEYESCRTDSQLGQCAGVLSITVQPYTPTTVRADLRGANCSRFTTGGAPGIYWNNHQPTGDSAGLYLFTGGAVVTMGRELTLENVDASKIKNAVKALRPLDTPSLPKPDYDAAALVALCAKTS
jgi:hypothetical protein